MNEMKLHGMFMEVDCKQTNENNSELNKRNKKKKTHTLNQNIHKNNTSKDVTPFRDTHLQISHTKST